MPSLYTITYQLAAPFVGSNGTIVNVVPATVTVSPTPNSKTPPYVAPDPANGPTAVKVVGSQSINIVVLNAPGNPNMLYPVGIAVQNPAVRSRPTSIFPTATVGTTNPPSMQLTDNAGSDQSGTSYEFVVLFQDSNGYIGTLDPRITNDAM